MSGKNEEKTQAAADRIKAAALSAAKGLSRAQAERAATAAARNVNAYGQKEEGPSRWQERKEAKRQMYLMSTEKAVKLGERKDQKLSVSSSTGNQSSQCQKCFQSGHWTYECKNERVYMSRPSRTQQLKNPKLKMTLSASSELDNPDIQKEEKVGKVEKKKDKTKSKSSKRKHRGRSESDTDSSEASVFESDSESSVTGSEYSSDESSSSSSSDSEERRRKRKKQKKRGHHKYSDSSDSESSESEESESDSDSDSGKRSKRKGKRHSRRH